MSTLRIDIAGKGNGQANVSRNDAAPGDAVSILLVSPTSGFAFEMLWTPKGATAHAVQDISGEKRVTFTVPANTRGTYRFRYRDSTTGTFIEREIAVLTQYRALRIPALGSKASTTASLVNQAVAESDNNAFYTGDSRLNDMAGQNFAGYTIDVEKLFLTLDALAGVVDGLSTQGGGSVPQSVTDHLAQLDQTTTSQGQRITAAEGQATTLGQRVTTLEQAPAPSGGSSSGGAGGWQKVLDRNFTQDSAITFVDGNFTFNGKTWKGLRLSKADVAAVVPGQGLVIDHGPQNTAWYHTDDSEPRIQIGLLDLIPDFVFGEDDLRITAQFSVQGTTSYDLGGIAIEKVDFQAGQNWTHKLYHGFNPSQSRYGQMLYGAAEGYTVIPVADNVNRLFLRGLTEAVYSSRQTAAAANVANDVAFQETDLNVRSYWALATSLAGEQSTFNGTDNNTMHQVHAPRVKKASELAIVIGVQSGNTNNNAVLTVQRLRIEYRKGGGSAGAAAAAERTMKQSAHQDVTGVTAYNLGAFAFKAGEKLPATVRSLIGAQGGSATLELVDDTTSNVVATASTSNALAAVAFAGEVTFPTTGIYSMRLRGSGAGTVASFRGIDWVVTA